MWLQPTFLVAMMAAPVLGTVVAGAVVIATNAMSVDKSK
jgi:hypothetical protein